MQGIKATEHTCSLWKPRDSGTTVVGLQGQNYTELVSDSQVALNIQAVNPLIHGRYRTSLVFSKISDIAASHPSSLSSTFNLRYGL